MLDDLPKVTHINPLGANGTLDKVIRLINWRFSARAARWNTPQQINLDLAHSERPLSTRIMAGLCGFFTRLLFQISNSLLPRHGAFPIFCEAVPSGSHFQQHLPVAFKAGAYQPIISQLQPSLHCAAKARH